MARSALFDAELVRRRLSLVGAMLDVLRVIDLRLRAAERRASSSDSEHKWAVALREALAVLMPLIAVADAPQVVITTAVANAAASGGRIFLNPEWMDDAARKLCGSSGSCERSLVRGLAAHELSHHARAHSRPARGAHVEELTADAWAGYLLARTHGELAPYLTLVGSGAAEGSVTHPPAHQRVAVATAAARVGDAQARAEDCCARCVGGR